MLNSPPSRPGGSLGVVTVVHVAESFGAGVKSAIRDYTASTPEVEHHLIYSPRDDSPVSPVDFEGFARITELPSGQIARIRATRRALSAAPGAIVHAHSSFGGAYARTAVLATRRRPIVYTPHCYGFERRDVSAPVRGIYRMIEAVLALNTSAFAACSPREDRLSAWPLSRARRVYVPNVPPHELPQPRPLAERPGPLRLVTAGRLGIHKDPAFFVRAVEALRAAGQDVDPLWIGGGEGEYADALERAAIPMTGWLPRADAVEHLRSADVYLHTALWEGMPMVVLEAHAMGVPLIVRDIPAFEGLGLPLTIHSPEDLVREWPSLHDVQRRGAMVASAKAALAENVAARQTEVLLSLYTDLHAQQAQGRQK